tara:strand:- start:1520 stop:2059 length:540 start_codon:yes stop_codon:yes gene_type:complete
LSGKEEYIVVINEIGLRENVAMVLNDGFGRVFWAKRSGQDAWQFPQGGLDAGETFEQALYRELQEEIGLKPKDVAIIQVSKHCFKYTIPTAFQKNIGGRLCLGQKQKWFLLQLTTSPDRVCLDCNDIPEFDDWRWVSYWHPLGAIVPFKREVYRLALMEFHEKNYALQQLNHDEDMQAC